MNRTRMKVSAGLIAIAIGVAIGAAPTHAAAKKVDCDAVMQELNAGKKTKDVAAEMKISPSSVYRCKKKEMAAAKTGAKAGGEVAAKADAKTANEVAAKPAASPAAAPKP